MGRRKKKGASFVMLDRRLLFNEPAWRALSAPAKLVYIYLKGHFNGSNNGEIQLHYSTLKGIKGISSSGTVAKALKELEKGGWVEKTTRGGLYRHVSLYRLTEKYDSLPYAGR